jgi:hypothetical protein
MSPLTDGVSILFTHANSFIGILSALIFGTITFSVVLKAILADKLTSAEYFSLSLGGGLLLVSLVSITLFMFNILRNFYIGIFALTVIVIGVIILSPHARRRPALRPNLPLLALIVALVMFVILRMAFISRAIVPSYSDSALHYGIIQSLLKTYENSKSIFQSGYPVPTYYHIGFHILAAALAAITRTNINEIILILGQIILALIPIPIFFIVRNATKSDAAGLFTVLLASFGWGMPGYAVNWGKYPALISLITIQFVLSIAYILAQKENSRSEQLGLSSMLGLGILVSGLMHTRSLIIIGIAFAAWIIATFWRKLSKTLQFLTTILVLCGIIIEVIFIGSRAILAPVFDPYLHSGWLLTSTIILLSVFAFRASPRLAFSSSLAIFLLLSSMFIPIIGLIPGLGPQVLLDRPFVEMILYLPLSLLGGLGYAGLKQTLQVEHEQTHKKSRELSIFVFIPLFGLILINTLVSYNFYPSDCCKIMGYDDVVAIDWLGKNLPPHSRILIATTKVRVSIPDSLQGDAGADAGIWITPLTNRETFGWPNSSALNQQSAMNVFCTNKITYVYVGGTNQSFENSQLETNPNWYQLILSLPRARVYEIIGCPEGSAEYQQPG